MNSIQENLEKILSRPKTQGISTGLPSLDEAVHGLVPGHVITIGGVSSMGKSSLLRSLALSAARSVPVGIIAIEGGQFANVEILLYTLARLNYSQREKLKGKDLTKLERAKKQLKKLHPIFIDEGADTMYPDWILQREQKDNSIEQCIERMISQGVKIVFIDYLQLILWGAKSESETLRLKSITNKLARIAVANNIPVVLLAQLKKEAASREDPTPTLNDIRDGGFIVNDSDEVLLLHRPEYYEKGKELDLMSNAVETANIIVAKQRAGPTGMLNVNFLPSSMLWYEVEPTEEETNTDTFGDF